MRRFYGLVSDLNRLGYKTIANRRLDLDLVVYGETSGTVLNRRMRSEIRPTCIKPTIIIEKCQRKRKYITVTL